MDEMYGLYGGGGGGGEEYSERALMSPDNLVLPSEYQAWLFSAGFRDNRIPMYGFGSEEFVSSASGMSETASVTPDQEDAAETAIKSKIKSHPSYPRLLHAYLDCQKVMMTAMMITSNDFVVFHECNPNTKPTST
ncbi:hypothetical protein NL676_022567 [Syzygium grande]|nr:hypothetical protein NL676_022567 [Syzygium grande]